MVSILTDCALQSALIIAPVVGTVSTGEEVLIEHNYSPRSIVFLNIASNMAGHFVKCVAVKSTKYVYTQVVGFSDNADNLIDTTGGAAKYPMVDALHPEKDISIARTVAGAWNGYGYNAGIHPVAIEAIDSGITALLSQGDIVQSACVGATAGIAVILSKDYLYLPSLEYVDKMGVQANETDHGEF